MAFNWALIILSFAPLLMAQKPGCTNRTVVTIDDALLDQLSGRWYFIASALGYPLYKEETDRIQAATFYFNPQKTKDIMEGRIYVTNNNICVYEESEFIINRENGTFLKIDGNQTHVAHLALTKNPNAFLLYYFPEDKNFRGVTLSARTSKVSRKQLKEFQTIAKCLGFQENEITYTDWRKDKCKLLLKLHNRKGRQGKIQ